ncbi:tail fiber assembly protein [Providencia rettgeri]
MKYNTELPVVNFNENGFADKDGWVIVYKIDLRTREYLNVDVERTMEGFSLSESSFIDKPELPSKPDIAIVRSQDNKSWLYISDYRGKIVYSTETRQSFEVDFIGDLPTALTLLEPQTEFDVWDGKKWVIDTEAQKNALIVAAEQEKAKYLEEAEQYITMLERKVKLGMATEEDIELLKQWEVYSIKVSDIDTLTSPYNDWPAKP